MEFVKSGSEGHSMGFNYGDQKTRSIGDGRGT
jgi:hypothetical protein